MADLAFILVDIFSKAIGAREGFFDHKPTIAQRLHNPGCLERWEKQDGSPYPELNGFVDFPECTRPNCRHKDHPCEDGWRALRTQVRINVFKRGLTFAEFFEGKKGVYIGFSPAMRGHDAHGYAVFVLGRVNSALRTSADITTVVSSLVPAEAPR